LANANRNDRNEIRNAAKDARQAYLVAFATTATATTTTTPQVLEQAFCFIRNESQRQPQRRK
jgi:hypothetical protein